MNKKWLPILMVTTFSLSACNKPNQQLQVQAETHSSSASLTTANSVDIKDDLKTLDLVANKHSQAMLNAQDALNTALQNKELNTLSALLEQLKTRTTEFNAALDATNFKSHEVDALSEKFKQVHLLGLEIAQENSKNPPQPERINALKTQIGALQQSVLNDMRSLQYTAYTQPNPAEADHTSQQIKPNTEINVTDQTPVIATSDLSQDNAADIKHDLVVLSAVSQTAKHNAQDSFMDMQHALDSGNRNALMTAVKQITTRLHDLNQKYNAVTLKSTEVTEARERLKEENNLQIEMSNIILSASPDRQKFAELNNKWKNSQKMVEIEMEALRIKANTAS